MAEECFKTFTMGGITLHEEDMKDFSIDDIDIDRMIDGLGFNILKGAYEWLRNTHNR